MQPRALRGLLSVNGPALFLVLLCVSSWCLVGAGQAASPPAWACSTTDWPVGGPVTRCASSICNARLGPAGSSSAQVLDLNTGQSLYTHGGAYTPTELSIDDCCLLCRSRPACDAWQFCNDAAGCGGKGECASFNASGPHAQQLLKAAGAVPRCTADGRWPHTMCTLKRLAGTAAARAVTMVSSTSVATAAAPSPAKAPPVTRQQKSSGQEVAGSERHQQQQQQRAISNEQVSASRASSSRLSSSSSLWLLGPLPWLKPLKVTAITPGTSGSTSSTSSGGSSAAHSPPGPGGRPSLVQPSLVRAAPVVGVSLAAGSQSPNTLTDARGWVSGVLSPVPSCPPDLPHIFCTACAATSQPAMCHACAAKYVGPAANGARDCSACAALPSQALQQTCVADVTTGGGSGCIQWQKQQPRDPGSSSSHDGTAGASGDVLDVAVTEQCYACIATVGPAAGWLCSKCLEDGVDAKACFRCMAESPPAAPPPAATGNGSAAPPPAARRPLMGCAVCNRAGLNRTACSTCLSFPAIAKDALGFAAEACGGCASPAVQRLPALAAQCFGCVQRGLGLPCSQLAGPASSRTEQLDSIPAENVEVVSDYHDCLDSSRDTPGPTCNSCLMAVGASSGVSGSERQGLRKAMQRCLACVAAVKGAWLGATCADCWLPWGAGKGASGGGGDKCQACLLEVFKKLPDGSGAKCVSVLQK